ncbi:MAG: hypothetical protein IPL59_05410 [Candidatus Competibacteraceae bacterium]|uniref:hypothetical protein n=1 Tax=Candidatus Contendibacter odensensis TaxID=1400860 RepID=UPI0004BB48FA|nr:hypothetical protein [Candidatus Contendobacter odensis]MBK8534593.1 hypothetical protein [Candidatus Competibacteraceae bacterium]
MTAARTLIPPLREFSHRLIEYRIAAFQFRRQGSHLLMRDLSGSDLGLIKGRDLPQIDSSPCEARG